MNVVSPKKSATVGVIAILILGFLYYVFNSGEWQTGSRQIDWKAIPKKSSPPTEELHDKWIVLTTINKPTGDVKKLAEIKGWKVVVVGDTKTPKDWRLVF